MSHFANTFFIATSIAVQALTLVSAFATMTHSTLEAIDKTVMLEAIALVAQDAVLEFTASLTKNQITNSLCSTPFHHARACRLVAKNKTTFVALSYVISNTLNTKLARADGAVSLVLTNTTQGTFLLANIVVGTFETCLAFLAIVAVDETFAVLAAELVTRLTGGKLATTRRDRTMRDATERALKTRETIVVSLRMTIQ